MVTSLPLRRILKEEGQVSLGAPSTARHIVIRQAGSLTSVESGVVQRRDKTSEDDTKIKSVKSPLNLG